MRHGRCAVSKPAWKKEPVTAKAQGKIEQEWRNPEHTSTGALGIVHMLPQQRKVTFKLRGLKSVGLGFLDPLEVPEDDGRKSDGDDDQSLPAACGHQAAPAGL